MFLEVFNIMDTYVEPCVKFLVFKNKSKVAPTSGARDQTLSAIPFHPVGFSPLLCANANFAQSPCSPTKQKLQFAFRS